MAGTLTTRSHLGPLRLWVAKDRARAVAHVDFGSRWIDAASPGRHHRVSWVPTTGELYAADLAEAHAWLLATVTTRAELDEILAGWGTVGAGANPPLTWVEDRLSRWVAGRRSG